MSYRSDIQRAYESFERRRFADVSRLLAKQMPKSDQPDVRGVEWRLLNAELDASLITLGTHDGAATECGRYPDGKTVATAGKDGFIHLWDTGSRQKLKSFAPGIGPIHAMAVSPDGATLAIGGAPAVGTLVFARIHLLDSHTGQPQALVQRHKTTIESIQFSPDGKLIAAGSRYQEVELSTVAGKQLHSFMNDERNEEIAFSPDSKFLATLWKKKRQIRIWNCSTGVVAQEPIQCSQSVGSFGWLPDGSGIAVAGKYDPWIHVYDVQTGKILTKLTMGEPLPSSIQTINISDDEETIAAGDTDGKLHQWKIGLDSWRKHLDSVGTPAMVEPVMDPIAVDDDGVVSIVRISAGSTVTAHENGTVKLSISNESAARIHSFESDTTAAATLSDQSIFLGSSDGSIHRFHFDSEQATQVLPPSEFEVLDMAVSADGTRLAAVFQSSRVDLINLENAQVRWSQPSEFEAEDKNFQVALSPDGRIVASAGDDKQLVVWDTDRKQMIFSRQFPGVSWAIAFSRDGQLVAHGQEQIHVFRTDSGELVHRFRGASVEDLQFSDGQHFLASGHGDGSIRLFDLASGAERILRGLAREICSVAFSEDDRTILGAEYHRVREAIQLWDVQSGEAYGEIANPLIRHERGDGSSSKIFTTGRQVIVCTIGAPDTKIAVWDFSR